MAAILRGSLVFFVICSVFSFPAFSQSLTETLQSAYQNNAGYAAEIARLEKAEERVKQANSYIRPSLSLQASLTDSESWPSSSGSDGTSAYTLNLSQPVYAGGGIRAGANYARAQFDASKQNLLSLEQSLFFDAITFHVNVARDQEILAIRLNNVEVLSAQLRAARDRFEVDEITRTDVAQAEARLSASKAQLSAARATLESSRAAYSRVVGMQAKNPEKLLPADISVDNLDVVVSQALDNNPEILQSRLLETVAQENIKIAQAKLRPTVSVQASIGNSLQTPSFTGDTYTTSSISAVFSMPLYAGGFNRSNVRSARAIADEARFSTNQVRMSLVESASNAWHAYLSARAVIESSRQAVLANEIAFEGVQQEAFVGLRTMLDVLNAEQELLNTRLNVASAERDLVVASYRILAVVGKLRATDLNL